MDKLIYERGEEAREPQKIKLEIPDDLTCQEFLIVCLRMAQALGYHDNTIREAFGRDIEEEANDEFENFISEQLQKNKIVIDKNQLEFLFDWKKSKNDKKDK